MSWGRCLPFVNGEDMLKRIPGARWFETAAFQVSVPRREAVVPGVVGSRKQPSKFLFPEVKLLFPGARWFETAAFQVSVPRSEAVVPGVVGSRQQPSKFLFPEVKLLVPGALVGSRE